MPDINVNINLPPEVLEQLKIPPRLADFAQRLFGPLAEGADWLTDQIRFFRFRSWVKVLTRAEQIAKEASIEAKRLPIKFLVPLMEKCSLEEEESELIELWARLLVSAASDFESKHALYVDILSQIGSNEALLLRHIWEDAKDKSYSELDMLLGLYNQGSYWGSRNLEAIEREGEGFTMIVGSRSPVSEKLRGGGTEKQNVHSLLVLERQNLIKIQSHRAAGGSDQEHFIIKAVLTPLGFDFVRCCEGIDSGEN